MMRDAPVDKRPDISIMSARMYVCVCMFSVYTYMCMHAYMFTYVYICIIYVYTCTRTHTHTYIHTHLPTCPWHPRDWLHAVQALSKNPCI